MVHNYYLYEKDGQLSFVPWDYNLSFAGFQLNSASSAVNLAIDEAVSGADLEDRPLFAALMEVEEYKEQYHAYLKEIVKDYFNSGYFEEKLTATKERIAEYVKTDATAFVTYEEFTAGADTLLTFALLRSESVEGQLEGSIPSTDEGQKEDSSNLVDAQNITISDMGVQGGGGGGMKNVTNKRGNMEQLAETGAQAEMDSQMPEDGEEMPGGQMIQSGENLENGEGFGAGERPQKGKRPENGERPENKMDVRGDGVLQPGNSQSQVIARCVWIGISLVIMLAAILLVKLCPRRRFWV